MMCIGFGTSGIATIIVLLVLFVQAHGNARAFTARVPAQVGWKPANSLAFPVKAATAGAWKIESRKNGYPPVRPMTLKKSQPAKTRIWNIVEGSDALMDDLKATFGTDKGVRKATAPDTQSVVVDGVTVPEIKAFLRGTDNYVILEEPAARLADKARRKKAVEENTANRKINEEKKAAAEAAKVSAEGGEDAARALFTTSLADITSTFSVVLFGFCMGAGVIFAIFSYRHRASSTHKEPFLAAHM
eukprot:gnl/TRDRNA2_/TRDRNA2_194094_c0_seq1.p1 gnl/TRDRNA2_/TRDRNA2_194094_c0~~gnl/TRDRNA2_/TRDRNA2_194094_c0_seq1.p1  ORF type:complete len:245 (-),score=59.88 gnl/TRDRNA2_/TRDRNA2_194094_c0_seq1:120-854(-)